MAVMPLLKFIHATGRFKSHFGKDKVDKINTISRCNGKLRIAADKLDSSIRKAVSNKHKQALMQRQGQLPPPPASLTSRTRRLPPPPPPCPPAIPTTCPCPSPPISPLPLSSCPICQSPQLHLPSTSISTPSPPSLLLSGCASSECTLSSPPPLLLQVSQQHHPRLSHFITTVHLQGC